MELYLIMRSGISLCEGFNLLAEDESDKDLKALLTSLYQKSESGVEPHVALRETGAFPKYMTDMVEIGVKTGHLESVLKALSDYYDRQIAISRGIKSAVVYPVILFLMLIVVITVLVIEVLPIFSDVFAQLGGTMSPVATIFLSVGAALRRGRWIIIGILIAIIAFFVLIRTIPPLRNRLTKRTDTLLSRLKLGRLTGTARFAAAMSMTLSSGLDTDASLEMAQRLCSPVSATGLRISKCRSLILEGSTFSDSVSEAGLLTPLYCRMLSVGVKTGSSDIVMDEIAKRSSEELSNAIERAVGKVEPALVIVMSVLVGLILLSVMLPLMGIMSSIG